jgi:chitinase
MTSWSQKRPGAGKFTPEDIDSSLCTHVIYAFATLKNHKLTEADEKDGEMYERVVKLREKNPNLKVCQTMADLMRVETEMLVLHLQQQYSREC